MAKFFHAKQLKFMQFGAGKMQIETDHLGREVFLYSETSRLCSHEGNNSCLLPFHGTNHLRMIH